MKRVQVFAGVLHSYQRPTTVSLTGRGSSGSPPRDSKLVLGRSKGNRMGSSSVTSMKNLRSPNPVLCLRSGIPHDEGPLHSEF
jgi:hypothetical protein